MSWKFGNKVYRNLEEQVLENQKNSLKNAADIAELDNKGDVERILYLEMAGDEFVGDDKTLPAYGATNLFEYFQKVGYLVAQFDKGYNQFMFAISRNTTDDGFINFDFGSPSDDAAETIKRISYILSIDTETDTVNFAFDDIYDYIPYSVDFEQLYDMLYPVSVDYQTVADNGQVQLLYDAQIMELHPHVWLRIDQYVNNEPTVNYLKQVFYTIENGIVKIGFSSMVPGNSGIFVMLAARLDSNVFVVEQFNEV
jgi:hypothetical protein